MYQRCELNDPARGTCDLSLFGKGERNSATGRRPARAERAVRANPLQPERDGRVRWSAKLCENLALAILEKEKVVNHSRGK
jgi:hypothetical protein